ncbi:hypothetical protein ACJIZ3_017193 [Penstemon smallii]|uniref:Rad60/SUMO-like domain-containing protein n=1 Tax=Penstemon smallii TaxID=265156 RepID=A0ABD3SVG6_9LAMI
METESVVVEEAADKQVVPDDHHSVILTIKCNRKGEELPLTVKRRAKLKRPLMAFCHLFDLEYRSTRFVFDHRVISHDKSPNQLGMENYDQIDALIDGNGA